MDPERFFELLFARSSRAYVTLLLIGANAAVYLLSAALAGNLWQIPSTVLLKIGANHAPLVLNGEAWRLLSAMFLHGGLLHIGLNMFALYQAGQIVERLFGSRGFLLIYLGAGLAGNVASIWWNPHTVSVGASGAIFGVYGALLAYLRAQPDSLPMSVFKEIRSSTTFFVGYSLFAGFALPGIDNGAHIGGLLGGVLLGFGFAQPLAAATPLRLVSMRAGLALVLLLAASAGLWYSVARTDAQLRADSGLHSAVTRFGREELQMDRASDALLAEARLGRITPEVAGSRLRDEVVPRWNAQIALLDGLQLGSGESAEKRRLFVRYAQTRRDAVALLAEALEKQDADLLAQSRQRRAEAESIIASMVRADGAAGKEGSQRPAQPGD